MVDILVYCSFFFFFFFCNTSKRLSDIDSKVIKMNKNNIKGSILLQESYFLVLKQKKSKFSENMPGTAEMSSQDHDLFMWTTTCPIKLLPDTLLKKSPSLVDSAIIVTFKVRADPPPPWVYTGLSLTL